MTVNDRDVARPAIVTDLGARAAYSEGGGIYRILPSGVTLPRDLADLERLVRWARATRTQLIPRGAGSGMTGGNVGRGVVVDMSQGFREVVPDWGARTIKVGASVTANEVNDRARPFGLRLPPDPSSSAFATSGGMAATNAAGPRTVRSGSVRKWIAALDVVDARGDVRRVARGGGNAGPFELPGGAETEIRRAARHTRKNSSGYGLEPFVETGDELDLLIGSEGTLAFITGVEWRLDSIPPDVGGAALGFASLDALTDAVPFLVALNPSAVELLDATFLDLVRCASPLDVPNAVEGLLLVEFERETQAAARGAVGDAIRGLKDHTVLVEPAIDRATLEKLWSIRRLASPALARLPETRRSLQVVEDGCVPLEQLGAYVRGIRAAAERAGVPVAIFGHAGDGHVHVNALPDVTRPGWKEAVSALLDDVTAILVDLGGVPSGEHGVGRLRSGLLSRFYGPAITELFRALKHAYDPERILNPGAILPSGDWSPLADLKVGADAAPIPAGIAERLREIERRANWHISKLELAGAGHSRSPF